MKSKIYFFYVLLAMGLLLLLVRLFELQVVLGARNRELAEGNRIRREIFPAPRGVIFDRNGKPLVRNVPVYRIKETKEAEETGRADGYKIITREEALRIEAQGGEEVENLRLDVGREYLYGPILAHVLGYLDWELRGAIGIEERYNQALTGVDGGEIYEVDTQGNKIREIEKIESVPGEDLHLSIDSDLSRVAYEALAGGQGRKGAVVVTEAKTGQVLALVSSPSFDPNLLVRAKESVSSADGQERERIEELLVDPEKPFFNRAIGGLYPPGSTFKIVTAVAGLEEERIEAETLIEDPGVIKIGEYSYANWYFTRYGKTEGEINIAWAIKRSTDTFFYKVGEWLGADLLAEWAKAFGLGRATGVDLTGEADGLVPTPDWKEKRTGERWFLGNTYHFAIGQADLLTTPLQVNMMTAVIANDGKLCLPRVKEQESERAREYQDLKLQEKTLDLVKEGLKEACSPGGTAAIFFDFSAPGLPAGRQVACKTGTAEYGDPEGKTHAWLTAYAPIDDPEIVVTAIVEGGGEGSVTAAPIVKQIMEEWFSR